MGRIGLNRRAKRLKNRPALLKTHAAGLFEQQIGFAPDLSAPRRLSERLCALYLCAEDPLRTVLVCRSAQMELLRARRLDQWIPRTWASCAKYRDVPWKELPDTVLLKADHLPGEELLLDRTVKGWKRLAKRTIKRWMRTNAFELCPLPEYATAKPHVFLEEAREGERLSVLCIGGEPRAMYWHNDLSCVLDGSGAALHGKNAPPPDCIPEISALCREVSADFPFMKLELLIGPGQPKCMGISLFERPAFFRAIPRELDEELGSMLKLPKN